MRVYQQGETADIYFEIKNTAGVLGNPTIVATSVVDPDGSTKVDASVVNTNHAAGQYSHYYNIPTDGVKGWWKCFVHTTDGTGADEKYTIEVEGFEVK